MSKRLRELVMQALPVVQILLLLLFLVGEVLLTEATKERGPSANTTLQAQTRKHHIQKRQARPSQFTGKCTANEEGHVSPVPANSDLIWICRSGQWIPFELLPSTGYVYSLPGQSCKHIKDTLANQCSQRPQSGIYWVKVTEQCSAQEQTMQVYCDMHTDGGGWALVWKHSYIEVSNLTTNMFYNSSFFRPCTDLASGWCNVPGKIRFQPEEMMIVAYHDSTTVYAYKGTFNRNLDHDWTGATLLGNVRAITDRCTKSGTGVPIPIQENDLTGMVFDKQVDGNTDTVHGTLSSPSNDEHWEECHLPSSISSSPRNVQMTMAIYVR